MKNYTDKEIINIARVCHEANRAWCEAHGDTTQKAWEEAEPWQQMATISGVKFRLETPNAPDSAMHDAWMESLIKDGWTYGEVKDNEAKTHPSLVPFDKLSEFDKKKDTLFANIVDALK